MLGEQSIVVAGLGLMGASLALALRKNGYPGRLTALVRTEAAREEAVRRGVVDAAFTDFAAAMDGATLAVLCAPVRACAELAAALAPYAGPDTVVTDAGSTKGWICRRASAALPGGRFVGSHPVAGSEKQGMDAARADLYSGALCVVTPPPDVREEAVERVERMWRLAGTRTRRMAPEEHDRLLARTSHLPHVAAAALARAIGRDRAGETGAFCGTGFYDSTRVAAGSIEMWNDILMTNTAAVAEELLAFKTGVEEVYEALRAGRFDEVRAFLAEARDARTALLEGRQAAASAVSGATQRADAEPRGK